MLVLALEGAESVAVQAGYSDDAEGLVSGASGPR